MEYPKAIYLMTNEVITITLEEEAKIKQDLVSGAEWIQVQGNLINAKSVSKIGDHHATAEINRIEGMQEKTNLKLKGEETKKIEYVEPDYYIDKHTGEKMYG